ncbi:MAG: helix-turn-helix transcriptional regulator [Solirubrobacterales bacterium]
MATPSGAAIAARFGDNLRNARKNAGLSQEEAGIRASLHRTEIGLLERGERIPRIDTAIKLAGAVGVHLSELVAGIEWSPGFARPGQFAATRGRGETGDV